MDKKALYESIMKNVAIEVKKALNEEYAIIKDRRGRPTQSSKLFNLYLKNPKPGCVFEKTIRAHVFNDMDNLNINIYLDNIASIDRFRLLIIGKVHDVMSLYKDTEYDHIKGDKYYTSIYNINDLESFANDLKQHYKELRQCEGFPRFRVLPTSPAPVINTKKRKQKNDLNDEQLQIVHDYMTEYGKGVDIDTISKETLETLAKYNLKDDGFVYSVCRPIRDDSDADAPALVYKLTSKYNIEMTNAIRLAYKYQCQYEYNCYVNYMYVSSIHLNKYLRDNY